jgi:hypothetical protein
MGPSFQKASNSHGVIDRNHRIRLRLKSIRQGRTSPEWAMRQTSYHYFIGMNLRGHSRKQPRPFDPESLAMTGSLLARQLNRPGA